MYKPQALQNERGMNMITRKDIEKLNRIRNEKKRLENLEKALTAELIAKATEDGHTWKNLSYTITEGHTTFPDREKIATLPNSEQYYKTTTYTKLSIKT